MTNFINRNKKASKVMAIGVFTNVILFGVKLWIGLAANNIAIITDAINNLGDVVGCLLSLIFFVVMVRCKKNEKFPHGYGRLEQLSTFLMSLIIVFIGVSFFISSLNRLMLASLVLFKWTYFGIMVGTILIKVGLALFYYFENKKIKSDVLRCAFLDSLTDAAITSMTVIGLLLTRYIQLRTDGIFGIIVSSVMIINGIKLFIGSARSLLGAQIEPSLKKEIFDYLLQNEIVKEILSCEYHDYGINERKLYINAIFTNPHQHDIIKNAQNNVFEQYGIKIIFIHEVSS